MSNLFHKATITLILKTHKYPTKRENYRATSIMNIYAKIPNKMFVN